MPSGVIIGRFLPFHSGHVQLIRQAVERRPNLCILVLSQETDPIPGWTRYAWVKNTFPELDVRHLPAYNAPDVARIRSCTPNDADTLFEGGEKHRNLAASLGWEHVFIERKQEISAADLLYDPMDHFDLLPEEVRPYFIRRIALLGPESSGKSHLAKELAAHFNTKYVEEYGRTYCERFGMDLEPLDFAHIAGGQLYREDEMARQANRVLFCDTDLLVTQVWSEIYFKGHCQPWIMWANHLRRYDLFLLLKPDIPWKNDGLRAYEQQRSRMFERLLNELTARRLPHIVVSGDFEARTRQAIEAVEAVVSSSSRQYRL